MTQTLHSATKRATDLAEDVEIVRQANKIHLIINSIGGLLPGLPSSEYFTFRNVLEIACGPGSWMIELASAYPHLSIKGVDTRLSMLEYGQRLARAMCLPNVSFQLVNDMTGPFPFPDQSFDLISSHFISLFLYRDGWSRFLAECRRLLRPGGLLRLTEFEMGMSNAPNHENFVSLFLQAMQKAERCLSTSGRHLGTLSELESLLSDAGFHVGHTLDHTINYSSNAPSNAYSPEWRQDYLLLARGALGFIAAMEVVSKTEVEEVHRRQIEEMSRPWFRATLSMRTFWGTR